MSSGDKSEPNPLQVGDDSDGASSKLLFDRSLIMKTQHQEHTIQPVPIMSEQISSVVTTVETEATEIANLRKLVHNLSYEVNQLKSAMPSPVSSPIPYHSSNSNHFNHVAEYLSTSPLDHQRSRTTPTHLLAQPTSVHYRDPSSNGGQVHSLHEALQKTNATIDRLVNEIAHLRQENNDLRRSYSIADPVLRNVPGTTIHPTTLPYHNTHTSVFTPIGNATQYAPTVLHNPTSQPTSIIPFTMSLTNTLPNFSGKETEMPTKFITEFEIRACGLVGYNDDSLLRAVQQALSDSALTWFAQVQQEQPIRTWLKFKDLFLRRFRTPEKIESFRGHLRILWQTDNESTMDYFERLKALISEIEPAASHDYIKRKFLQKLRKDIRDRMTLGLTSTLSELVQKATEIESSIVQQKIDDQLRNIQNNDKTKAVKSTTINYLSNVSQNHSQSSKLYNDQSVYDEYNYYPQYNVNRRHSFGNYSPRTFTNSNKSTPRPSTTQDTYSNNQSILRPNMKSPRRNDNRWCSFCSSTSHSWHYCYSNPHGPNYQLKPSPSAKQHQHYHQTITTSSTNSPPQYSDQHRYSQSSTQDTFTNQHQYNQHYQQPSSNQYQSRPRSPISGNGQRSQY